ncbi:hypothetical protein [Lysobacter xanthus]
MRAALVAAAAALLATPVAILATVLLLPMWSWMETQWGVEAVGHASLSAWCFVATGLVVVPSAALLAWRVSRRRDAVG